MIRGITAAYHLLFGMLILCSLAVAPCQSADITVRVINIKDGHEVGDLPIWIYAVEENSTGKVVGEPLRARTGPNGTTIVHLPYPPPSRVFLMQEVSGNIGGCSSPIFFTREILNRGVVGDTKGHGCDPKSIKGKFSAEPGEVIVFVRNLKWWEKIQD
jgi:hypothetical protein